MAVLHLRFDIDSEVHPELHDMLSSIGSSRSQAERLRQLAAAGLVWERLRLQAYGRIEVPDLGLEPASAPVGGVSFPEKATAPAVQIVLQGHAPTARNADLADFVDLSDAVVVPPLDAPAPAPRGEAQDSLPLQEIRSALLALPVLTEVVTVADLPNMQAHAAANEATRAAHTSGGTMPTGAQIHELAPLPKTATRSRLLRMKEKGLFKNE